MKSFKIIVLSLLLVTTACAQSTQTKPAKKTQQTAKKSKPDYSKVDYSARSNIIKNPAKLTGDEKAIFYHPYFLKLTSEEAKNLKPLKIKAEFEKLGIFLTDKERFNNAWNFYDLSLLFHKKSCEQWESFKDLAPQSKN